MTIFLANTPGEKVPCMQHLMRHVLLFFSANLSQKIDDKFFHLRLELYNTAFAVKLLEWTAD